MTRVEMLKELARMVQILTRSNNLNRRIRQ